MNTLQRISLLSIAFLLLPLTSIPAMAASQNDAQLQQKADFLCSQITASPQFNYEKYFAEGFRKKILASTVVQILAGIYNEDGACKSTSLKLLPPQSALIQLDTTTNSYKIRVALDENFLIAGFRFLGRGNPKITIHDQIQLMTELARVPGTHSVYLTGFAPEQPFIDIRSSQRMPLGSEFKLYILNHLAQRIQQGSVRWTDPVAIEAKNKSLPSGDFFKKPNGEVLTVSELASAMISKSDNTATDHLIDHLGRENIETAMTGLNSFIPDNRPLLKTMDLFRLRMMPTSELVKYQASPVQQKRRYLFELSGAMTRDEVFNRLIQWNQPKDFELAEWYASTKDVCRTMDSLRLAGARDPEILRILSLNVPALSVEDDPHFEFAGYKGGSEPGVLTMTFMLRTRAHRWACLSMAFNDLAAPLAEEHLMELAWALANYSGELLDAKK